MAAPTFALFFWPLFGMGLFAVLGQARGLVWFVVLGYLFLPESWLLNVPGLPPFGKLHSIVLGILLGLLVTVNGAAPLPPPRKGVKRVTNGFMLLLLVAPLVTTLTNSDGFMRLGEWVPPMGFSDLLGQLYLTLCMLAVFVAARRLLYAPETHRNILTAIVAMALFYSLLVFYELRMSPQINNIVYGYFPHSWLQHIRPGGWRPLVFLGHGLELGFYLATAVLAAAGAFRSSSIEGRTLFFPAMLYLFAVLVFSRNLGATLICATLLPAAIMLRPRIHLRIAAIVAILFLSYPLTRDIYIEVIQAGAQFSSPQRQQSLQFRFDNEDLMLARAFERPVAGWGGWGRWRVYDDDFGALSTSDGIWIIQLAQWGWMGFIGLFGLVTAPVLFLLRQARTRQVPPATSILVLILAANLIYMIPNATLSPVGLLVAGSLAGYVQFTMNGTRATAASEAKTDTRRRARYTRFGPNSDSSDSGRLSRFGGRS